MTLHSRFYGRRSTSPAILPNLSFSVGKISWSAVGGPTLCDVLCEGDLQDLWLLLDMLLSPTEIYNDNGDLVWWGFISDIELQIDAIRVELSLDTIANRVAVAYVQSSAATPVGLRGATVWEQDDLSVDEYGTFERLESSGMGGALDAEKLRRALLSNYAYPVPQVSTSLDQTGVVATLVCRGWWDLLSRRFYQNTDTGNIETTDQIRKIMSTVGTEFFSGVDVIDTTGVYPPEYQNGDANAKEIISRLLEYGTANDRRLLAYVTPERYLRVYEQPDPLVLDLVLTTRGSVEDRMGTELTSSSPPVGRWASITEALPWHSAGKFVSGIDAVFIESAEWDEDRGAFSRLEPIGSRTYNVSRVIPL